MKTSKHTPAPWRAEHFIGVSRVRTSTGQIAAIISYETGDDEGAEATRADADLIAAAPDLLTASEAILDLLDFVEFELRSGKTVADLRAAVVKAKGGAQ